MRHDFLQGLGIKEEEEGGGGREVPTLHPNFQPQENFEKIDYKWIPLCSFVCLELGFKTFIILEFPIFVYVTLFLVKLSSELVQLRDFNSLGRKNEPTVLSYVLNSNEH